MELNREQIVKALEWCSSGGNCFNCLENEKTPLLSKEGCMAVQMRNALALIKELTEENERLRAENENKCKDCAGCIADKCDCANIEAYAVEKYKSAIIQYYSQPKYQPTKEHPIKHTQIEYLFVVLDQIAKEMEEKYAKLN